MSTPKPQLFTPLQLGAVRLKHRVVLAPLTRFRADRDAVPSDLAAEYYAQRASDGGLLISEGTFIAAEAGGMAGVPGIYSREQIAKWKTITDAVHAKGGKFFCQLWALGRVASPKVVPVVYGPVSETYVADPRKPENGVQVTAMTPADIERFVGHYRQAARNAIEAGFDGVEIHGANGYIIDQFLQSVTNKRTDAYGPSLAARLRFPLAVLSAVCDAIGPERVGIRMSPFGRVQGMREPQPLATFLPWATAIATKFPGLAYVHAVEPRANGAGDMSARLFVSEDSLQPIREVVRNAGIAFISAGAYKPQSAIEAADRTEDLVAFGRYFISNPDLPARIQHGWELTPYDRSTFYTQGAKGYIDYPVYKGESARL